jgi:hypothetical protein
MKGNNDPYATGANSVPRLASFPNHFFKPEAGLLESAWAVSPVNQERQLEMSMLSGLPAPFHSFLSASAL